MQYVETNPALANQINEGIALIRSLPVPDVLGATTKADLLGFSGIPGEQAQSTRLFPSFAKNTPLILPEWDMQPRFQNPS